ncbi:MAG: hypothetical protein ACLGHJ_01935 [Gammaproteobacteria bacterium]
MARLPALSLLLAALLPAVWCAPALAEDAWKPRPQKVFTEKPRIEDYADYSTFLVDIMEYRRQKEAQAAEAATRPATPAPAAAPASGPVDDPSLYFIGGPESLEDALARAKKLPHPVYSEPERFGRSTANSFPMPPLEGEDLSANEVPGQLADMDTVDPEAYNEEGAKQDAEGQVARNPTGDRKDREQQADEGTNPAYRASYDRDSRFVTDTQGNRYYIPIMIKNEVDYTIIRRLEIDVEVIRN